MDKRKLIQIIEKELEELKVLTEEVSESEKDTGLIIEIALSKARLLCQEIELLRELSAKEKAALATGNQEEDEEEFTEEDELSDISISDPELEIVNPEEEEDLDYSPDEFDEADAIEDEEEEEEIEEEGDLTEEEDNQEKEEDEEVAVEKTDDEELIDFDNHTEEKEQPEAETPGQEPVQTEFEIGQQAEFREINIEEAEDEDLEPVITSPTPNIADRPVMREIPKPEEAVQEKKAGNEPFQKGPSLNDTIGESKPGEPSLSSGPISSLRAAIGLNDRFLFIREIFGNNTDKYNKIIDHLDKLETIQQAVEYLKANLTLQKNDTSMKFVDLLKRRFTK